MVLLKHFQPVTLSERVPPSESKGPPRIGTTRLFGVVLSFGRFFDSLRSLRMTGYWAAPVILLVGGAAALRVTRRAADDRG